MTALMCYFFPNIAASWVQQLLTFSVMSLFSLFLLQPRFMRLVHKGARSNGPGVLLGKQAKGMTDLRGSGLETGKVLFEGTEWSATPIDGSPDIPAGSMVEVVQMDGLTLRVKLVQPENKLGG